MKKNLISSNEKDLEVRLGVLRNRFNILTFIQNSGMRWIDIVMSKENNECFPTSCYIACYGAGKNN